MRSTGRYGARVPPAPAPADPINGTRSETTFSPAVPALYCFRVDEEDPVHQAHEPRAQAAGVVALSDGVSVRRIGFGAMRIMQAGVEESRVLLRRALELGVNLIDTADVYGRDGAGERLIAKALHPYPEGLVIATKGGQVMVGGKPMPNGSPEHLRAACEMSLQRLRVSEIHLYQLHNADPDVPLEESLGALAELRSEGKVQHIGVCNLFGGRLERALATAPIVSVQNRYSLGDRATEADLRACEKRGIAFISYSPLHGGALASGGGELVRIATGHSATAAQVALAWLLNRSPVTVPIPGTCSLQHLEENVAAVRLRLTNEEVARLEAQNLSR
jgi:pyridoxine 4-dehydrogenase